MDGIRGKETEYSGVENGASRPASESPASARSKSTANNVDQAAGKSQPQEMNFHQLKRLLSQIYLIRTPYGYVLGRTNPTISTTSIARRYIQTSKPRMNSAYGEFINVLLLVMYSIFFAFGCYLKVDIGMKKLDLQKSYFFRRLFYA